MNALKQYIALRDLSAEIKPGEGLYDLLGDAMDLLWYSYLTEDERIFLKSGDKDFPRERCGCKKGIRIITVNHCGGHAYDTDWRKDE